MPRMMGADLMGHMNSLRLGKIGEHCSGTQMSVVPKARLKEKS